MFIDLDRNLIEGEDPRYSGSVEMIYFPMGEIHPRLSIVPDDYADVLCRIRNSEDIIKIILVTNSLKKMGIRLQTLIVPYLPYARQDRVTQQGEPHSLQAIASILDNLGYGEIIAVDVHSNVAEACFTKSRFINYKPIYNFKKWANQLGFNLEECTIIAPDEGAVKRTYEYVQEFGAKFISCSKKRDPITGKLSGFTVNGKIQTKDAIVIDDICDGGGTFIGLAPEIVLAGATKLHLWVTHGGFTKGTNQLLEYYNNIGFTNSYKPIEYMGHEFENDRITQIKINFRET